MANHDLAERYLGGEVEVHAVRRHRARNEGRRLGHGVDFLLPESQQSALLPSTVARAHAAAERQTGRSQSPGAPRPEERQHPRDLRERRRRIQAGRARSRRLGDPRRPAIVEPPIQVLAVVKLDGRIDRSRDARQIIRSRPTVSRTN